MTALVKHATVLHWHEALNRPFFGRDDYTYTGPQTFVEHDDDPNPMVAAPGTALRLDYETWQDMGGPTEITVTVQPGDHLNSGQS